MHLLCGYAVERGVRALPGVGSAAVDYRSALLLVEGDAVDPGAVAAAVREAGCRVAGDMRPPCGGELVHAADAGVITQHTRVDRMQYELPHIAEYGPGGGAGGAPRGHGHDMSEPAMAAAMERHMRNRFFAALVLTIPVVLLSPVAVNTLGIELIGSMNARNVLMLALSAQIVWWAGWVFVGGAATSLRHGALNMAVLVATGVLAAWGASVLLTFVGRETFFEAAAMLVTFVLFGHWMEMKSRRGAGDALRALMAVVPATTTVIRAGEDVEVPTDEVVVGDLIRLRPGARVPVDGEVVEGDSAVQEPGPGRIDPRPQGAGRRARGGFPQRQRGARDADDPGGGRHDTAGRSSRWSSVPRHRRRPDSGWPTTRRRCSSSSRSARGC